MKQVTIWNDGTVWIFIAGVLIGAAGALTLVGV